MFGTQPPSHGPQPGGLAVSLVCTRCGSSIHVERTADWTALVRDLGCEPERGSLELTGCCAECQAMGRGPGRWGRA